MPVVGDRNYGADYERRDGARNICAKACGHDDTIFSLLREEGSVAFWFCEVLAVRRWEGVFAS